MTPLLDVIVVLAPIWSSHPQHSAADTWLNDKEITICPLVELGFLRISTNTKRPFNVSMADARKALEKFTLELQPARILDDLPALDSHPQKSDQVTDHYLSDLAFKHGLKLATFDAGIKHRAAEVIA